MNLLYSLIFRMFTTKIGGSRHGINIAVGAIGFDQSFLADYVMKDARQRGWSTRKFYNRLDKIGHEGFSQVVSKRPRRINNNLRKFS